jgi:hypothetical protein
VWVGELAGDTRNPFGGVHRWKSLERAVDDGELGQKGNVDGGMDERSPTVNFGSERIVPNRV